MIRPHGSARFVRLSDPRRQYLELQDELDDAIAGVLRRGVFTPDEQVDAFEADVAAWMGLPHAVGVGSGSSALMLTLRALGVGRGDEVAVTANLDISAVSPISQLGAHPLWIDIDPRTHNMSPVDLESRLTPQTRAVVVVHSHGIPAALDDLMCIAGHRNVPVVEDATLGPGASYRGARIGSSGVAACLSMAPTKPLGGLGNAGVVVTHSETVAARVRTLANYGFTSDSIESIRSGLPGATFRYEEAGVNATMDEIQAAVLRVKLRYVDAWADRRRAYSKIYDSILNVFTNEVIGRHETSQGAIAAPRTYVLSHENRDRIAMDLYRERVLTAVHYYPTLHVQPPYGSPKKAGDLPATERVAKRLLCLPVAPELSESDVEYAAQATFRVVESLHTKSL
ncbi:MAG: erythromycin biosynthesis sensory transduction protein eryC1 [Dehalococcoidales bacterium]|nr:erythromycin biosynthesis sensory transduction protein eryC1 [Dehalococcoidales bacterium]